MLKIHLNPEYEVICTDVDAQEQLYVGNSKTGEGNHAVKQVGTINRSL